MSRLAVLIAFVAVLTLSPRASVPARAPERGARCGALPHVSGWHTHTVGVIKTERYTHDTALALGPRGRATALWVDGAGLHAARRAGHWRRARTLDPKAEILQPSRGATSPTGAFVAGWRSSPTGLDARISVLAGQAGRTPGRPRIMQRASRHGDLLKPPVAAVAADGGAVVTWNDARGGLTGRPNVRFVAVREPGARGFGRPLTLGVATGAGDGAAVAAAASGRALVASVAADALDYGERAPDGLWSVRGQAGIFPRLPSYVIGAAIGPAGQAIVVARGGRGELWASTRASGSDDFAPARPLSNRAAITEAVMKPEPSGGAVVSWIERRGAAHLGHVRIAAARAGQPFGPPADFPGAASTPRELSLAALDDGSAVAGWTLDCGDRGTHVLVGRRRADGALSQPREVSGPRARPVPPAVALDPTGKPAVLWATRRLNGRPVFRVSTR